MVKSSSSVAHAPFINWPVRENHARVADKRLRAQVCVRAAQILSKVTRHATYSALAAVNDETDQMSDKLA